MQEIKRAYRCMAHHTSSHERLRTSCSREGEGHMGYLRVCAAPKGTDQYIFSRFI